MQSSLEALFVVFSASILASDRARFNEHTCNKTTISSFWGLFFLFVFVGFFGGPGKESVCCFGGFWGFIFLNNPVSS